MGAVMCDNSRNMLSDDKMIESKVPYSSLETYSQVLKSDNTRKMLADNNLDESKLPGSSLEMYGKVGKLKNELLETEQIEEWYMNNWEDKRVICRQQLEQHIREKEEIKLEKEVMEERKSLAEDMKKENLEIKGVVQNGSPESMWNSDNETQRKTESCVNKNLKIAQNLKIPVSWKYMWDLDIIPSFIFRLSRERVEILEILDKKVKIMSDSE